MFTSRSQNGQVSGGRTYPPGLFPTGGIAFLLFAQATTTSTQPTTTTTTAAFAQGWQPHSCQQFCGWGPYQATWAPSTFIVRNLKYNQIFKEIVG